MNAHDWTISFSPGDFGGFCGCGAARSVGANVAAFDAGGECPGPQPTSHRWTLAVVADFARAACGGCGEHRAWPVPHRLGTDPQPAPLDLSGDCPAVAAVPA